MDTRQRLACARAALMVTAMLVGAACGPDNPLAPDVPAGGGHGAVERACTPGAGQSGQMIEIRHRSEGGMGHSVTITFDGLRDKPAHSPFSRYSESGFAVTAPRGRWVILTAYGQSTAAIGFERQATEPTITGEVVINAGGAPFTFGAVDLYSSITPIPYTMTGFFQACPVFTVSDVVPNTYGNFVTVHNPRWTDAIDTLVILLSNPATPGYLNPVGLDNVVVTR
jgi:hypothetical protein